MINQQFTKIFSEAKELINSYSAAIFNSGRNAAAQLFVEKGLPTKDSEEYLYCPLFDALATDWGMNFNRLTFGLKSEEMFHCSVPGIKTTTAYIVNDVWRNDESEIDLGSGGFVCSMAHASQAHSDILEKYYDTILKDNCDGFVLLNKMFVQDGLFVYVPKGVKLELPLQVVTMMRAGINIMANSRNLIIIEENAELKFIDCDHAFDNSIYFASRITEVSVGENAQFNYYSLESSSSTMNNLHKYVVTQQRNSRLNMSFYGLTNGSTRNDVEVDLNGEGCETWLGGMLLSDKNQRSENYTIIRHHVPNCKSEELFKYILDDKSIGGFSGRVVVDEGAQKTESYQTNKNICISSEARALGRPQLEIYADDVKCGHGATTGILDTAALFYMQQRGIGLKEARMLLLQAFSAEVVAKIDSEALRDRLHLLIEKRLRGEEMRCTNCRAN